MCRERTCGIGHINWAASGSPRPDRDPSDPRMEADGIEIQKLGDELPVSQEELLELRERYLAKPMMVGGILSADAKHAAIIIEMDRTSTDPLEEIRLDPEGGDGLANLYPQVTDDAINKILSRPEYEGINFYHSGDVPLNAVINIIIANESAFLDMITTLVIALILFFFFRSAVGVLAPVFVVQMGVISTVAFIVVIGFYWAVSVVMEIIIKQCGRFSAKRGFDHV